ncbi:hypothetical protein M5K25_020058 [Dendrobium thyrsiflorum]|uniref:Uncharacterized protein n=1 Tax=Dendrobium thyrsiflorum TaxID=117978 RepID=A0ABD0U9Q9_DENTH
MNPSNILDQTHSLYELKLPVELHLLLVSLRTLIEWPTDRGEDRGKQDEQSGVETCKRSTQNSKANQFFPTLPQFTYKNPMSKSSADVRDNAEEAREREKDGYLRSEQAPVTPSDPTGRRSSNCNTSDLTRERRRSEAGEVQQQRRNGEEEKQTLVERQRSRAATSELPLFFPIQRVSTGIVK